ncbi:MAG: hypothetical protein J7L69_11790 [Desulfobulbaceae bacterium]|nr:hypothetical protein [Desulfobulbaceae bacterium]
MTAKTTDGKEVYNDQRIYMPYPGRFGRGSEMGRGPYEKSGLLAETSLPPMKHVHEKFEIIYPHAVVVKDGKKQHELINDELVVSVKLLYLPFGEMDGYEVLWFEEEKKIDLKTEWVWR